MEPIIKYENCEEIYTGPTVVNGGDNCSLTGGMKRSYSEISDGANSGNNYTPSSYAMQVQGVYQQRNYFQPPPPQQSQQQSTHHQQQQQRGMTPNVSTVKRTRRVEGNVLFGPPFFELSDMESNGGTLTARCLSCHVMLRGHRNVSSNFIKHMKRVHPEMHKIYESIKLFKHRGGYAAAELNVKWNENNTKYDSDANLLSNSNTADNAEPPFFDANTFLENISRVSAVTADDERNSETTENSGTPPDSNADVLDTTENSVDSQQPTERTGIANEKCAETTKSAETAQVDLSQKALQLMSRMFDEKLKAFVTKTEFVETTQNITNLVEQQKVPNTNTTAINDEEMKASVNSALQTQLTQLQQQYQNLEQRLHQTERSKRQMQRELESLDKLMQRRKLIVRNLKVDNNEQPQEAVEKLLRERLELPDMSLKKVTVLTGGQNKLQNNKQNLLVELAEANDARAIFRQCKHLRGTGIYIEPQMSQHARKRKEKLLVLRKELLRRNTELKVLVRNTQLIVGSQQFYWDDVEGLCVGNLYSVESEETDAVEQLKELTKLDLKEFISVLKNYNVR